MEYCTETLHFTLYLIIAVILTNNLRVLLPMLGDAILSRRKYLNRYNIKISSRAQRLLHPDDE